MPPLSRGTTSNVIGVMTGGAERAQFSLCSDNPVGSPHHASGYVSLDRFSLVNVLGLYEGGISSGAAKDAAHVPSGCVSSLGSGALQKRKEFLWLTRALRAGREGKDCCVSIAFSFHSYMVDPASSRMLIPRSKPACVRSRGTCKNQSVCEWLITAATNLHDMGPLRHLSVRRDYNVFKTSRFCLAVCPDAIFRASVVEMRCTVLKLK